MMILEFSKRMLCATLTLLPAILSATHASGETQVSATQSSDVSGYPRADYGELLTSAGARVAVWTCDATRKIPPERVQESAALFDRRLHVVLENVVATPDRSPDPLPAPIGDVKLPVFALLGARKAHVENLAVVPGSPLIVIGKDQVANCGDKVWLWLDRQRRHRGRDPVYHINLSPYDALDAWIGGAPLWCRHGGFPFSYYTRLGKTAEALLSRKAAIWADNPDVVAGQDGSSREPCSRAKRDHSRSKDSSNSQPPSPSTVINQEAVVSIMLAQRGRLGAV